MAQTRKKPELLAPAGDWEKLQMAVLYGADAVYLAGTSFGMRSFAGNFDDEELPRAVRFAHDHGVKVHATVNTMPRWDEAVQLPAHLERLDADGIPCGAGYVFAQNACRPLRAAHRYGHRAFCRKRRERRALPEKQPEARQRLCPREKAA